MNVKSMRFVSVVALALLLATVGCSGRSVTGWNPETRTVTLFVPTTVPVPDGYSYLGTTKVLVTGETDVITVSPTDVISSDVFVKGDSVLLAQRLVKTNRVAQFRYLGGSKTEAWGSEWRTREYGLDTAQANSEFASYLSFLRENNVTVPAHMSVRVLDKLASDFILVRMITLEPAADATAFAELSPVPSFDRMYDQELATEAKKSAYFVD